MTLRREDILGADDIPSEVVDVAEWGGKIRMRGLTAAERDDYERSQLSSLRPGTPTELTYQNIRASLVVRCIVDEEGQRVFADADADALGSKSAVVLDRLFDVARRLSGLSAGDVEELARGFEPAQGESRSSA